MVLAQAFEQYLQKKEAFLDKFIDCGSDQELFAASYIHGHLSVVAAQVFDLQDGEIDRETIDQYTKRFCEALYTSIDTAIDKKELDDEDAADVNTMLCQLLDLDQRIT
ncbi:YfcL family protein [Agaribacter flavus]|uniref:YfcL family protein n=1 Tax=Agaribacter flavus TaxID=1902781 RepID=A0ABV7FJR4_9ALTE